MQAPALPTQVTIQLVLDSVQAKYPGNEHVKPCSPANHDSACYDPNKPHITYHAYLKKETCENREGVTCEEDRGMWMPIDKPVFSTKD